MKELKKTASFVDIAEVTVYSVVDEKGADVPSLK